MTPPSPPPPPPPGLGFGPNSVQLQPRFLTTALHCLSLGGPISEVPMKANPQTRMLRVLPPAAPMDVHSERPPPSCLAHPLPRSARNTKGECGAGRDPRDPALSIDGWVPKETPSQKRTPHLTRSRNTLKSEPPQRAPDPVIANPSNPGRTCSR